MTSTDQSTAGPASTTDEDAMDRAVRPQDDLFRHVNGGWLARHVIPADRSRDGSFRALHDRAEEQVRDIIRDAAAIVAAEPGGAGGDQSPEGPTALTEDLHEAELIGALYSSFMDTEAIEDVGTEALAADLALVTGFEPADGGTDLPARTRALGALQASGVGGAVSFWVDNDSEDPDAYVVFLHQSGLGLPDEAYYRDPAHAPIREAYVAHVATMLTLSGVADSAAEADAAAARIMALETTLAAGHWDRVSDRDATRTHNPMSLAGLAEIAPGFDWATWVEAVGAPATAFERVIVREPSYATAFAQAWSEGDGRAWHDWLTWRVVRSRAPYLPAAIVDENFAFYGRTLTGAEELRERWKRGVSIVEGVLGEAIGKVYVHRHFPPGHKAAMEQLVADLVAAYRESISALDWMGEQTRRRALAKLEAFTPKIGYPDKWRDYSNLTLDPGDLLGNVRAANAFELAYELGKLGRPVDRDEWFMPPQTVNAYYNPGMNEVVFPAAILQPPFFDIDADDAWNYGGIGAVIGHEIGHGFDDQGSKYDGTGRLTDWWEPTDRTEFERRTAALAAQYDAFSPAQLGGSHHVNGALTVGENIGDLGGLTIALKAYRIALARRGLDEAPVIDGLSGLQRFFYSWARIWRIKARDEEMIRLLSIDPHSPEEFRCNGVVRNLDAFAEAFAVGPDDALYLPPEERVHIW
jgi:putative endopeptidase